MEHEICDGVYGEAASSVQGLVDANSTLLYPLPLDGGIDSKLGNGADSFIVFVWARVFRRR